MSRNIKENALKVKNLFDSWTQDNQALSTTHSLELRFFQSATDLAEQELETCLKLIEETSGDDYRASSIGWNPRTKKQEMQDEMMLYVLIQGKAQTTKRSRPESGDSPKTSKVRKSSSSTVRATAQEHEDKLIPKIETPPAATDLNEDQASVGDTGRSASSSEILGFMSFMFTYDDPPHDAREVIYIYEIHMKDKLRGYGLGSKLLQFVEDAAARCGIEKTMLTVFAANTRARALYKKLGYEKDECSPKDRKIRKRVIEADYIIMSKYVK